jgi:hypothetical protein
MTGAGACATSWQGGDARFADREAEREDAPDQDLSGQWLAGTRPGNSHRLR